MWGLTKAVFSFLNGPRVFASTTRLPMILSHYIRTSFDDHFGSRRLRLSGHFSQRGMPTCSELDDIVERSFLFCLGYFLYGKLNALEASAVSEVREGLVENDDGFDLVLADQKEKVRVI